MNLPPQAFSQDQNRQLDSWEAMAVRSEFSPALLAKEAGVTLRTLQRFFCRRYGQTVGGWLRNLRLRMAYDRLKTAKSVKEVAYGLSYKQPSHFTRDFKSHYGVPPSRLCSASLALPHLVAAASEFSQLVLAL